MSGNRWLIKQCSVAFGQGRGSHFAAQWQICSKVRPPLSRGSETLAAIPCPFPSLGEMPSALDWEASIPVGHGGDKPRFCPPALGEGRLGEDLLLTCSGQIQLWEKHRGNGESSQPSPLLALIAAPGTDFGEGKSIITELASGGMEEKKKQSKANKHQGRTTWQRTEFCMSRFHHMKSCFRWHMRLT